MKLAMFAADDGRHHLGVVRDDTIVDITRASDGTSWGQSILDLIQGGHDAMQQLTSLLNDVGDEYDLPLSDVRLTAPIPRPPKNVFCLGKNYPEHIAEGARAWGDADEKPAAPIFFTKPHTSIVGSGAAIRHPSNSEQLDYEGELAVIIGKRGRAIPVERVGEHVFGHVLLNDVTARDLQRLGPQWFLGKGCDTFCPIGPWVVVADPDVPQPSYDIVVTVNGEERQRFNTQQMIFSIPEMISALSRNITLEPGDVVATGTGPGCGFAMSPPAFLQVGDTVMVEADGLGKLENVVVAAEEP